MFQTETNWFDLPLCWPSEVFFLELCLPRPLSGRLSTSESDVRELCRPVWLDAFIRALFFLARSDSGAERIRSDSWFSGSKPTLTNAFLVLVKAEVTEPITEEISTKKKKKKASVEVRHFHRTRPVETWLQFSSKLPVKFNKTSVEWPTNTRYAQPISKITSFTVILTIQLANSGR